MPLLKQGSSGPMVKALQKTLKALGFDPKGADGKFGADTEAAVRAFQKTKGLDIDGKVGRNTLAALRLDARGGDEPSGGVTTDPAVTTGGTARVATGSKILTEDDYNAAAGLLNCEIAAIKAVAEVESRGAGFLTDGRPKILFERHKFHGFTGGKYDASNPDISKKSAGGYGAGGTHQWDRFDEAFALDASAAVKACSWGKFQVMGFNFGVCGFANLDDFRAAMEKDEGEHLKAFCNFIAGNSLDGALRDRQWATFAKGYNGKDYKINDYDTKLAAAYKKYKDQSPGSPQTAGLEPGGTRTSTAAPMTLKELAQKECSTEKLAPLARQIAKTLIASLPAAEVIDISAHVDIVGGSTLPYLQRAAGEALIAAINEAGRKPKLVHALRTLPQQYMVFYQYTHHLCNIPLAASPGSSPHERGIAIDIQEHESWIEVLKRHNWIWRGRADPPHFNFHGPQHADFGIAEIKAFQQTWNDHNPNDLIKVDGSYGTNTENKLLLAPIAGW